MKKEIMEQWVAALRSGYYTQTKDILRDMNGFCCLGVLCDISKEGQWKNNTFIDAHDESSDSILPPHIAKWAGINDPAGLFGEDMGVFYKKVDGKTIVTDLEDEDCEIEPAISLAEINDAGFTFEQIADFIEKNWKYL